MSRCGDFSYMILQYPSRSPVTWGTVSLFAHARRRSSAGGIDELQRASSRQISWSSIAIVYDLWRHWSRATTCHSSWRLRLGGRSSQLGGRSWKRTNPPTRLTRKETGWCHTLSSRYFDASSDVILFIYLKSNNLTKEWWNKHVTKVIRTV